MHEDLLKQLIREEVQAAINENTELSELFGFGKSDGEDHLTEWMITVMDGIAMDDEGNRWPVQGWNDGHYSGRQASAIVSHAPREKPSRRKTGKVNKEQLEVMDALVKARPGSFIKSIRDQVARGVALSDKQKKAVRQNLYRARMKKEADLFR